ncbi:hypothetical protein CRG98_031795 [Punica granatum]|uniref:Uncharacterized protein n=1 Tax=Punica granatum TaxID=22663 RepID=A0A2I0IV20_PUNGR|nr:hypothetical protein CRG98_031795 [Punica granatum]
MAPRAAALAPGRRDDGPRGANFGAPKRYRQGFTDNTRYLFCSSHNKTQDHLLVRLAVRLAGVLIASSSPNSYRNNHSDCASTQ